ncbi:MAG: hypothetical protein LBG46_07130 [Elusimicrobiota bacterium]|nr:hypothetical protein [Elusimicrobiota bacterium]
MITTAILNVNRPKNKRAYKIEDIIGRDVNEEVIKEIDMADLIKRLHGRKGR